jgi:hypothetical protein
MPVRLDELHSTSSPEVIAADLPCGRCSYNLRGLKLSGQCPECGKPIRRPKARAVFGDQMSGAPLMWLMWYSRGTRLLCLGGWLMAMGLVAWALVGHLACLLLAIAGSVAWSIGTVIVTRPRPKTMEKGVDPEHEWRAWRSWARWSQPAWTVALAGAAVVQVMGWYTPVAVVPVAVFLLAGVVGWWPLMLMQSNLAYWASDTELADKLRNCSWASALGMGIGAAMFGMIGGMNGGLSGGFIVVGYFASAMILSVWIGLGLFALGYTLSALWGLMRLGHWAVLAHLNVDMRDERLRERARRELAKAAAARAKSGSV